MKKIWWVVIAVVVVILFLIGGEVYKRQTNSKTNSSSTEKDEAPTVTTNFVDVDKIAAITKFRSCQGHIVVPQDGSETRSNMKHYFYLKKEFTSAQGMVPLYAPFDGYVFDIFSEEGEGFSDRVAESRDVSFSKEKGFLSRSGWMLTILHIIPTSSLKKGDAVKAGQLVGHVALEKIPPYYSFDVTYSKMGTFPKKVDGWNSPYAALDSVFNHMDSAILARFQLFGITTPESFIISKSIRDASPCQYRSGSVQFDRELNKDWANDWIGNIKDAV
ncbi:MAG: hypothetical protein NUV80_05470 [Candidatus Berkelbacteria bacterium]|nr:hypothetical protein [Candidatus Berkelbacteria bacterium]MCR4307985.1 hypothetical protein [Candidatus Berkelbacteria bacterium]